MRPSAKGKVLRSCPKEIKRFLKEDGEFKLTKKKSTRPNWMVPEGLDVKGELRVVDILGKPAVLVSNPSRFNDYIRTSPVVKIVRSTKHTVTFQTEGGVYKLERIGS